MGIFTYVFLLLLIGSVVGTNLAPLEKVIEPVQGQYIIILKEEVNLDQFISYMEVGAMAEGADLTIRYKFGQDMNGFSVRIDDKFVDWLRSLEGVKYIEEVGIARPDQQQYYPPSWGLDRVNQEDLPLDNYYSWSYFGYGVNVYVVDSGIRFSHQDFSGRARLFHDYIGDGMGGNDCMGHGTHCAGIVGGVNYGLAKGATLHSVRIFGCSGGAGTDTIVAALDRIRYYGQKPGVVSMSFGAGSSTSVDTAARNLWNAGFVPVTSAGNDNSDACNYSPKRIPETIAVGATELATDPYGNKYDQRAYYSNWGRCVDLFAPGSDITSAYHGNDYDSVVMGGTSMACPHVAGACAKLLQSAPTYSPAAIKSLIVDYSAKDKIRSYTNHIGSGSPNILLYQYY